VFRERRTLTRGSRKSTPGALIKQKVSAFRTGTDLDTCSENLKSVGVRLLQT
jgi:hypothetical protein